MQKRMGAGDAELRGLVKDHRSGSGGTPANRRSGQVIADAEDVTPDASPRRNGSPLPHGSITASHGKGGSTSTTEEAPPAVKTLLEAWLTNTLTSILDKPIQRTNREDARVCVAPATDEQQGPPLVTGITHNVNDAGAPKLLPKKDAGRFVEQPYSDEAAPHAITKTFKMPPYLKIYDGTMDPEDHVTHYVTAVKGNDLAKEQVSSILLKKFGEALTGGALTWYSQLPARSIETFEEMADKFVTVHAWAKKAEARVNDIFAIKQSPGEALRDFLARFNRVRMTLPKCIRGNGSSSFPERVKQERFEGDQKS
ncbi:PREDICTED: uncharacterized protein LOC109231544 [Nicotiana attenuata]|uniref:uncharacterized protein LOC109231544 n=1 Tax=Nicotiana attenuata TaxID=49451 RepID=UPI00090585AD|nr:PREDICTED: uncharacterized protein LOC109231544 [Nicotiana attenuata]